MTLKLHNTLTKKIEDFTPISDESVTLYTCGPTVYDFLHVGNWAAYVYWDTLVRTLQTNDFKINRVMNITDVGHLVSDEDEGEDKLQKGARLEGKTAWEVAEFYGQDFLKGMKRLNMIEPEHIAKATDFIDEQLELVRTLKNKGYSYQIDDGIYFDTSKFPTYADFAGLDLDAQKAGARVTFNAEKRNPSDFALWKFSPVGEKRDMEWETPVDLLDKQQVAVGGAVPTSTRVITEEGGADQPTGPVMGFPGWHLECSAMAMSILGNTIDIHTGGIDHIPVHHTNEIAQSESASGQKFANFWIHNNHIKANGTKISKSLGNGYTLDDLEEKGFSPLDYRMFILQGHYSNEGNFTFENLEAAKQRLKNWRSVAALRHQTHDTVGDHSDNDDPSLAVVGAVREALSDNLNTPEVLRIIDEVFTHLESHSRERIDQDALEGLLEAIDDMLGLQLLNSTPDISDEIKQKILERQQVREAKNWDSSDRIRDELLKDGIVLNDTKDGTLWQYA
ncbi:MAG: cysteine--tRNA ligase [Candidatus Saccharibacteria bacterium]